MFGSYGRAAALSAVHFVSAAGVDNAIHHSFGLQRDLCAVRNTRGGIGKAAMIHNGAMPVVEVDPETYEVRADGELLTCAPATVLPMSQRYFLF